MIEDSELMRLARIRAGVTGESVEQAAEALRPRGGSRGGGTPPERAERPAVEVVDASGNVPPAPTPPPLPLPPNG